MPRSWGEREDEAARGDRDPTATTRPARPTLRKAASVRPRRRSARYAVSAITRRLRGPLPGSVRACRRTLHGARSRPRDRGSGHEQLAASLGIGHCHHASSVAITDRRARVVTSRGVKALAKSEARPGIWLVDAPEPEVGINDVLIRVLRTGICGTDLHIHSVGRLGAAHHSRADGRRPRVRGRGRRDRLERERLRAGRHRQRRGPPRVRSLPQLHGRPAAPLRAHPGRRRRPPGSVRRVHLRCR